MYHNTGKSTVMQLTLILMVFSYIILLILLKPFLNIFNPFMLLVALALLNSPLVITVLISYPWFVFQPPMFIML
jgi:hypothetical protein